MTSAGLTTAGAATRQAILRAARRLFGTLRTLDAAGYNVPYEPFNRTYATNQTYGGVLRVLPWLSLGGGYFESSLFTDSVSFELTGRPRQPVPWCAAAWTPPPAALA